ncbi:hypothetical protein ACA910_010744 [Epithemia clementina (nom. ined.)]
MVDQTTDNSPVHAVVVDETEGDTHDSTSKRTYTDIVIHCNPARWTFFGLVMIGVVASAFAIPISIWRGRRDSNDDNVPQLELFTPPFEEGLPLLSEKVLEGYNSVEEFEADLWKIAESYINGVVGQQIGLTSYSSFGIVTPRLAVMQTVMDDAPMQPMMMAKTGAVAMNSAVANEAVGDKVNDYDTNNQESGVSEGDNVVTDGKIAAAAYGEYIVCWNVTDGKLLQKMKLDVTDDETGRANPYVRIHTLILKNNRLVVAAGGYGYHPQQSTRRVLSAYGDTRIFVFEINSLGKNNMELNLLAKRDINGNFQSIRLVGDSIHFVVSSELNFYPFLFEPLSRFQKPFVGLDDGGYTDAVRRIATENTITDFVKQASAEILECGELPRMVRLNRWTTEEALEGASLMEHYLYNKGYARSLTTVVSFNISKISTGSPDPLQCLSVAGSFFPVPSWSVKVYAAPDTLVMALEGYDFSRTRTKFIDSTYIVAYDLRGRSVLPKALGNVEGNVLNQYSFRVAGSILQVATSIQQQWTWFRGNPPVGRRLKTVGSIISVPTTENWVITMDLKGENGKMTELDRLKLGKEGEVFTTVRFYDGLAYAVTFRKMDPFYVLNTTDPRHLVIAGELDNITGWSSYLEPMNSDKSVMLAIGQESDDQGRTLGMSISVFDAQDLKNVKVAARFLIESSTDMWSDSEGLRDKNAIRFNAETGRLILPLRLSGNSEKDYFRGFRVFIVKPDSIVEEIKCLVDLSDFYNPYAYSRETLEPRSMIISGSFMSTMGSHVVMKDLDTCITDWQLTIQ